MARLDKVKNLTGLAEWYAASPRLRSLVNLVIVGEAWAGWEARWLEVELRRHEVELRRQV